MIKLPSIKLLFESFVKTFLRFPVAIVYSLVAAVFACLVVDLGRYDSDKNLEQLFLKIVMSASMGVFSSIALSLYNERLKKGTTGYLVTSVLKLVFPLLYFFFLPDELNIRTGVRFGMLMLALHMLVSFAPFAKYGTINGFWQYNKTLFIHFLTSILYTSVLYLGISASIGTTSLLFDINFPSNLYLKLWFLLVGFFNTSFFLSGVPEYYNELDNEQEFPQGLKLFTQFVLIPLVAIYLVILYAYELKILVSMDLPKGIVAYLVIGYAIFGILALLLVYPIQNNSENRWIKIFSKWFYIALYPLIGLLFWAIIVRISAYGITENRYIILALTIWLALITSYFVFNRHKNIKLIPVSLFFFTLIAAYGPLSAFEVSKFSQRARLSGLLEKNGLLTDGKIVSTNNNLGEKEYEKIESVVDYLTYRHGLSSLQKFTDINLDSLEKSLSMSRWALKDTAMAIIGIPSAYQIASKRNSEYPNYFAGENIDFDIKGFDKMALVDKYNLEQKNAAFSYDSENNLLKFKDGAEEAYIDFKPALKRIAEERNLRGRQNEEVSLVFEGKKLRAKVIFQNVNFRYDTEGINDLNFSFYWLTKEKTEGKK